MVRPVTVGQKIWFMCFRNNPLVVITFQMKFWKLLQKCHFYVNDQCSKLSAFILWMSYDESTYFNTWNGYIEHKPTGSNWVLMVPSSFYASIIGFFPSWYILTIKDSPFFHASAINSTGGGDMDLCMVSSVVSYQLEIFWDFKLEWMAVRLEIWVRTRLCFFN